MHVRALYRRAQPYTCSRGFPQEQSTYYATTVLWRGPGRSGGTVYMILVSHCVCSKVLPAALGQRDGDIFTVERLRCTVPYICYKTRLRARMCLKPCPHDRQCRHSCIGIMCEALFESICAAVRHTRPRSAHPPPAHFTLALRARGSGAHRVPTQAPTSCSWRRKSWSRILQRADDARHGRDALPSCRPASRPRCASPHRSAFALCGSVLEGRPSRRRAPATRMPVTAAYQW